MRRLIGIVAVSVALFAAPAPAGGLHPEGGHEEAPKDLTLNAKPRRVDRGDRTRLIAVLSPCEQATADDVVQFRRAGTVFGEKGASECRAVVKVRVRRVTAFSAYSPEDFDSLEATSNTVRVSVNLA